MKIFFVVQGLFEKSDSIGYDCVYQYEMTRQHYGPDAEVRLFAERADQSRYPLTLIQPIDELHPHLGDPDLLLIYHFCDGWPELEALLADCNAKVIVRWHNNTPPWFFAEYSRKSVARTTAGFRTIQSLGAREQYAFICNSQFTRRQLQALGVTSGILPIVYPASRYLDKRSIFASKPALSYERQESTRLLFVSRLAAHKGHRHVILIAYELKKISPHPVVVSFPGRSDENLHGYVNELLELAASLSVEVQIPGEVDDAELERLYSESTVFVCMSEHEGFGLPVFEAMARNLPVVVWANTALAEILHEHPLAFRILDHAAIAHAIDALKSASRRKSIVQYQWKNILPEYTHELVFSQLIRAISAANELTSHEDGHTMVSRQTPKPIMDTLDNFVSRYDLSSYNALLSMHENAGLLGNWESQIVGSDHFLSNCGPIKACPFVTTIIENGKHLIFGPYMHLPGGVYRVQFHMSLFCPNYHAEAGFCFDVIADGKQQLGTKNISMASLVKGENWHLDFLVGQQGGKMEFRIKPFGFESDQHVDLLFYGIRLINMSGSLRQHGSNASGRHTVETPSIKAEGPNFSKDTYAIGPDMITTIVEDLRSIVDEGDFLTACYRAVLGREADQLGYNQYLIQLEEHRVSRADVVAEFFSSDEWRRQRGLI